jgi:hypothetical protein
MAIAFSNGFLSRNNVLIRNWLPILSTTRSLSLVLDILWLNRSDITLVVHDRQGVVFLHDAKILAIGKG